MTTTTQAIDVASRVADRVRENLGAQKYAMWFDQTARFDYRPRECVLRVAVPTRFAADWIGRHFASDLAAATREVVGPDASYALDVAPQDFATHETEAKVQGLDKVGPPAAAPVALRRAGSENQRPADTASPFRHRLESYVTGPCNQLAYAAARRMADLDDPTTNHPLFLHGICGVGKTHLLQGICATAKSHRPAAKVRYLTGEQFTNQFITAVRNNKLEAFRRRMRRLDLLAIDDVHFIASKEKTQQEFLHCFEENDLAGARVLLASDRHPRQIAQFSEALVSRCVRGLVIEVTEPDAVTRKALISELARRRGLFLQPAVSELLAQRYDGSVRDLEGALARLHALATLTDQPRRGRGELIPVGRALVEQLPDFLSPVVRRPIRFETIQQSVCEYLMQDPKQLASSSRHKYLVLARSLLVYLARELTSMSYPEIAHAMGRKNHSTVITACQRMQKQLGADQPLLLPGANDQTTPRELVELLKRRVMRAGE
ncbi:MAG: DnaA/Hda family protein [Planctomycetota bacterium]